MIRKIALVIFLLVCAFYIAQGIYYYPQLPEKIASHFTMSGQANGWMAKSNFMTINYSIAGFIIITFMGLSFGLSKIPVSMLNMPNKNYWLSDEQKQKTCDFMSHYILWFGSMTVMLLTCINYHLFQFNKKKMQFLPYNKEIFSIYFVFTAIWIWGLYKRFGKKDKS